MDILIKEETTCILCTEQISQLSQSHSCFEKGQFSVESQLKSLPFQVSFQHGDIVCKDCYHKLLKRSWFVDELNKIDTELKEKYDARVEIVKDDLKRHADRELENTEISGDVKRVRLHSSTNGDDQQEDGAKLSFQEELKTEISIRDCLHGSSFASFSQSAVVPDHSRVSTTTQNAANIFLQNTHSPATTSQVRGLPATQTLPATSAQPQILGVPRGPGVSQVLGISQPTFAQQTPNGISQTPTPQVISHANTVPTHYASPGSIPGHGTLTQVVYSSHVPGQLTAQVVPVASPVPGGAPQYQYVVVQPQQAQPLIPGQQSQIQPITAAQQNIPSQQNIPAQQNIPTQQNIPAQGIPAQQHIPAQGIPAQPQPDRQHAAQQQQQTNQLQIPSSSSTTPNQDEEQETVVKVTIIWKSRTKERILSGNLQSVGMALARGTYKQMANAIYKVEPVKAELITMVLSSVKLECNRLCSKNNATLLRKSLPDDLENFSMEAVCKEWQEIAPIFYSFLLTCADVKAGEEKKHKHSLMRLAVAGSFLLKEKSNCMNALHRWGEWNSRDFFI